MKDLKNILNTAEKYKTSLIIISVILIITLLFLRTNTNVIEGFYSNIQAIMEPQYKNIDSKTTYWDNDIMNIVKENVKPMYIYTNYGTRTIDNINFNNKGVMSFSLFVDRPPVSYAKVNSILFDNNNNNSFNNDLNDDKITYNNINDFVEIGSIGKDDTTLDNTQFLDKYNYNININSLREGTLTEKNRKLSIIKDYIIDNTETNIPNIGNFYKSIAKYLLSNQGNDVYESMKNKEDLINSIVSSDIDSENIRTNQTLRSKNLTKSILNLSLKINNNNINYISDNGEYSNKIGLENYINELETVKTSIPNNVNDIRKISNSSSNILNTLGNIKIWVKLRDNYPPTNITDIEKKAFISKYPDLYDDNETKLSEGKVIDISLVGHTETLGHKLNIYDENISFVIIDKIEIPIGVKLSLYPTSSENNNFDIEIPYSVLSNNLIRLTPSESEGNQAGKLSSININDNLRHILNYCNTELIYKDSKWKFTITNFKYPVASLTNMIDHIKYSIMPSTLSSINRQELTPTLNKLQQFKRYITTTQTNLKTIKSEYTLLYNKFRDGNIPPPKIHFFKPKIVPETHIVIGHLALKSNHYDNNYLTENVQYKTIPKHCYIKIRDWEITDKIVEIESNNGKLSFYKNPETETILVQNNDRLPDGYIGRIVLCPDKDLTLLKLNNDNYKAKQKCNSLSKIKNKTKLISTMSDDTRSNMLENKIYKQSKSILNLREYANKLNEENMKGKIIHQEYNKNKLQNYLTTQKEDIVNALNKLKEGRNKYEININYPVEIIKNIIEIIANSDVMPTKKKIETIKKLKALETAGGARNQDKLNDILKDCPEFDMVGYFKRDPPCMGCRIPRDQT